MGVSLGKLPPVAEPADVGEICRRLFHPRHPRVVDERQGHAPFAEHLGEVRAEPAPVPYRDSVPEARWKPLDGVFADAHPLDGKGWRELQEEWAKPVSQFIHRAYEAFGLGFRADEVSLVRHLLWKLR